MGFNGGHWLNLVGWVFLAQLGTQHFSLSILYKLIDVEANLVVSVEVLRVALLKLDRGLRKLRKLIYYQTHLNASIARKRLTSADSNQLERPRVQCNHIIAQLSDFNMALGALVCRLIFTVKRESVACYVSREIVLSVRKKQLGRNLPHRTSNWLRIFLVKLERIAANAQKIY